MSEPICIDLQARFGKRYRIGWEADGAAKPQWPRDEWPWLMELRCRYGRVYPKGGEILQAMTDRPRIGAQLRNLPCVLKAHGDDEVVVHFHVDDIGQVLALLKPYRRRQLSEAQRVRLRAMGFQREGHSPHVQSSLSDLRDAIAPSNDPRT
jgi:hypothetical protein